MPDIMTPLVLGFVAGFFLLAILTLTAFVKISVVMLIIRQSLGLQQVPGNMVIMALSGFLAVFISLPVFSASIATISEADGDLQSAQALFNLFNRAIGPFQDFIVRNIEPHNLMFLVRVSNEIWAGSGIQATDDMLVVQVPAFMISELTEAFRIGFLLYLPFVAIDLAITGILMALGMQQVQPNIIAVPFKLLTFVFVDGWANLVEGLILTYSG